MTSLYSPTNDDVRQRLRPFGIFFEKSLKDLIKGIRSNNETPEKLENFLAQALSECRQEATSPDFNLKTNAVLKLTYLEMYGYDMSWANFHILEVMSSSKLQQKRVGYLAASQSFYKDPEILMLATNLMRKDLKYDGNHDVVKVGIALSGLSTIVTPSLAADIADDLFIMLNSSKPYLRKKAVTALFKVFLQYPEALRDNFDKFTSKLEDDDISVVSATVSVVCELSKKNPKPFIQLSPLLYEILVTISNNWIIIRLLKLFTNLSKIEPKLRPKLLPKILELMESTVATSVLYESINCIVKGNILDKHDYGTAMVCLDRLHTFCDSSDPNLRYISCVLFYKIGKINTEFIAKFDKLVLRLLNDVDVSIRSKAIELVEGVVNEKNLKSIVANLLKQFVDEDVVLLQNEAIEIQNTKEIPIVIPDSYKIKIVNTIIHICSMNNFMHLVDFEWYNAVLWDLSILSQNLTDAMLGFKIGEQLRNIMVKVPSMRECTLSTIIKIISNVSIQNYFPGILKDCFWSLGEFSNHVDNGDDLIDIVINKEHYYSPEIQKIMIPALLKIFSNWCNSHSERDVERIKKIMSKLLLYFDFFTYSNHFEVQERAVEAVELLRLISEAIEEEEEGLPLLLSDVLPSLFNTYELKPISHGTQQKLQSSINVDCQTPFLSEEEYRAILEEQESQSLDDKDIHSDGSLSISIRGYAEGDIIDSSDDEPSATASLPANENQNELDLLRKEERESNPFYLTEENESFNTRVSDLLDLSDANSKTENSTLIRMNKKGPKVLDAAEEANTKGKNKKRKTKTKSKRKIEIIPDETFENDEAASNLASQSKVLPSNYSASTLNSSKGKINLKTHTKLEDFDFSKKEAIDNVSSAIKQSNYDTDQEELNRMRSRFEQQHLDNAPDDEGNEVIVIKKKKKSSKKKKKRNSSDKNLKVKEETIGA